MPRLIIGTGNRKKGLELAHLLASPAANLKLELLTLADFPHPLDVDETGDTFTANAALKAVQQAKHLGEWVLADDSGLAVDALNGAPGVYSARYAGLQATDDANNAKLLAALQGVPSEKRTARFVCHICLADPTGAIRAESEASCRGRIIDTERGPGGFGYDPLFMIAEYHRTFGEMSALVKSYLSHRSRAMALVAPKIYELFQ